MKEKWKKLPEGMKRLIAIRSAVAVLCLFLFFTVLFLFGDTLLYTPFLLGVLLLIISIARLLYVATQGYYITIKGICVHLDITPLRRRIKEITLECEGETSILLTMPIRERLKGLSVGDTVVVYVSDKTPVYQRNGDYWIADYYAVEIKKENAHDAFR